MARSRSTKTVKTRERSVLDESMTTSSAGQRRIEGVLIGTVAAIGNGIVVVDLPYPGFTQPIAARATLALDVSSTGRQVAVVFEGGRPDKPLVIGLLQPTSEAALSAERRDVELNGQRLVLTADHEIVLRCGKASITLTRAGKVLIRGEYLLSRSAGVNRIKGGSIQLN